MKSLTSEDKHMVTFAAFCLFLDPMDETLYLSSCMQVSGLQLCFFNKTYDEKW
jgi:hypothetical protein